MEELILCKCANTEHQMIFRTIDGDEDVYVTYHLLPLPFWQRIKYGVKYIFGYKSRYGAFDELILNPDDAAKFAKVVKYLRTNHNPIK